MSRIEPKGFTNCKSELKGCWISFHQDGAFHPVTGFPETMGRRQDFGSIEFESMEFLAYRNLKLKT